MLVGESQSFRVVDESGQMQHRVTWSISDTDAFMVSEADELSITAKKPGRYTIAARSPSGGGMATVEVVEGSTLPLGTVKWSSGNEGCKTTKIMPAVPSPGGPDVYEQSLCEDGGYISAYTSDGIQMWRRKVSTNGPRPRVEPGRPESLASMSNPADLNPKAPSLCDSIRVGMPRQTVLDIISERKLAFTERLSDHAWVSEEGNVECNIWFNDKSIITKKRKILNN